MERHKQAYHGDETWVEQRTREDKEKRLALIREEKRQKRLADAYIAVAATEAGRVVLADLVSEKTILFPILSYSGSGENSFSTGKAWFAANAKFYIRSLYEAKLIDRDTFIAIVEPEREEEE